MTIRQPAPPDVPSWIEMEPGERVIFHELPARRARLAAYVTSAGLFELWRRRTHFIVTDRRLIAVRGLVSRDRQVIPLGKVERATVRARGPSATVDVATVGGALGIQPIGPLGRGQAERLAEAVRRGGGS